MLSLSIYSMLKLGRLSMQKKVDKFEKHTIEIGIKYLREIVTK